MFRQKQCHFGRNNCFGGIIRFRPKFGFSNTDYFGFGVSVLNLFRLPTNQHTKFLPKEGRIPSEDLVLGPPTDSDRMVGILSVIAFACNIPREKISTRMNGNGERRNDDDDDGGGLRAGPCLITCASWTRGRQ